MALQIAAVCNSIAGLSVTGAVLRDVDQIPTEVDGRVPTIFPKPDGFITNFTMTRDSFGGGSTAKMTVTYDLTWRLCHSKVGASRMFDTYDNMVAIAALFLDAVLAVETLTGLVDIVPAEMLSFGPVTDPAGNLFHGCDIVLTITEFVN